MKEKTEKQVREELKNKGWTEKQNQVEVFDAIEAIYGAKEINRIK